MTNIKDRLLVVGSCDSQSGTKELLKFLQENYSTEQDYDELKGVIEPLNIKTAYYKTSIELLIDVLEEEQTIQDWTEELLDDELRELRDALSGLVLCIDSSDDRELYVKEFQRVLDKLSDENGEELGVYAWSGMYCIVLFGHYTQEEIEIIEDLALGVEVIHFHAEAEFNEFKERLGKARLKEMIEVHDWKELEEEQATEPQEVDNLEDIMTQLREAKLELAKLPSEEQDAFAQRIADKLTKNLF